MPAPSPAVARYLERAARDGVLPRAEVTAALRALGSAADQQTEPTPSSKSAERRQQILDVAARHFAQRGYRGTNLQDIAAEVSCTRQAFYYHFANKQEILATVTDVALGRVESLLETVAGDADVTSTAERLRTFIRRYVELNVAHPEAAALFGSFDELPDEIRALMRKRMSGVDHGVAGLIDEGVAAGEFTCADTLVAAMALLGAVNWMHQWYRPEGRLGWESIADTIVALHLDGLLAD